MKIDIMESHVITSLGKESTMVLVLSQASKIGMAQQNLIKIDFMESQAMTILGKELTTVSGVPVIVLSPALEGAFFLSKPNANTVSLKFCANCSNQ